MNSWIVLAAFFLRRCFCSQISCRLHHWAFRYRHRAMKPRIACWILITAGPVTRRGRGARLPNTWRSRRRIESCWREARRTRRLASAHRNSFWIVIVSRSYSRCLTINSIRGSRGDLPLMSQGMGMDRGAILMEMLMLESCSWLRGKCYLLKN